MHKVLPLAKPIIESYLHHAYQTSIIGLEEGTTPWLLSNYIQLYFDGNDSLPLQFYMPDETGYTWNFGCPFLDTQVIKKETITELHKDIKEFIIYALKHGNYVMTYINEKHVPQKSSYKKNDFSHMFFIDGYNLENQTFHHLGYNVENNSRRFGTSEITFENFIKAYHNNPNYLFHTHENVYLTRLNYNFQYDFNISQVLDQLTNLLHSSRQKKFNDDPNHVFGLNVYANLRRILKQNLESRIDMKLTPFLLLAEHKKLMVQRLEYMSTLKIMDNFLKEQHTYKQLEQRLIFLRNSALLYNRTKRVDVMDNMLDELIHIQTEEAEVLDAILHKMHMG
ncbi:hypothetical protein [Paenibacillus amylolyticus]|uniref:hypothetical protein n=1 Tax=Paenibacillus amylolyticus TaxID=1451 RepID=UPI003EC0FD1D